MFERRLYHHIDWALIAALAAICGIGLAMIYMFGRRGWLTYQLLGISSNVFFGPLGVAVAQILAYAPIAYLVLVLESQLLKPLLG